MGGGYDGFEAGAGVLEEQGEVDGRVAVLLDGVAEVVEHEREGLFGGGED